MMRSMFAGVSGLKTHQLRMDVIGNNIANVNTAGFKASRVNFQETLNQTLRSASAASGNRGGTNPQQIGLGVTVGSIDVLHTPGGTQPTGITTDLAIEGTGFFVLADGDQKFYTRAGIFDFDDYGNMFSKVNGMKVMGYMADNLGNISEAGSAIKPIQISLNEKINPIATTQVEFGGNLSPSAKVNTQASFVSGKPLGLDYTAGDETFDVTINGVTETITLTDTYTDFEELIAAVNTQLTNANVNATASLGDNNELIITSNRWGNDQSFSVVSATLDFGEPKVSQGENAETLNRTAVVYDSLGTTHRVNTAFTKTGPNQWGWVTTLADGGQTLGSGVIDFNADGTIKNPEDLGQITIPSHLLDPQQANDLVFELDFAGLTQYNEGSSVVVRNQNGFPSGSLDSVSIDTAGRIVGSFSNGLTKYLGQVALASFTNPGGLNKVGSTMFAESSNSGQAVNGIAGQDGFGTIAPNSLEMSNVDLSQEFTDMIITQRGFQANSRIITSSDEMLQELVNLKR